MSSIIHSVETPGDTVPGTPNAYTRSQKGNIIACMWASIIVKQASYMAYEKHRLGTSASDILSTLPSALEWWVDNLT